MAKRKKKVKKKEGSSWFVKLIVAGLVVLVLWAGGRFPWEGKTVYQRADAAMGVKILQPVYSAIASMVGATAENAYEALPKADSVSRPKIDESGDPLDKTTKEDQKGLDDLIKKKSKSD